MDETFQAVLDHVAMDQVNDMDLLQLDLALTGFAGGPMSIRSGNVASINGATILAGPIELLGGNVFVVDHDITSSEHVFCEDASSTISMSSIPLARNTPLEAMLANAAELLHHLHPCSSPKWLETIIARPLPSVSE